MATKNFYRVENNIKNELSNPNGEWKVTGEYKTRKEALETIFGILMTEDGGSNLDIANFRIIEVQEVDIKGTLYETAKVLEARFNRFHDEYEITHHGYEKEGFVRLARTDVEFPSLNVNDIKIILGTLKEVNKELPQGYEVFFVIDHKCRIELLMQRPETEKK